MKANEKRILEAIIVLASAYPQFEIKEETIEVYVQFLSDIDPDQLTKAVRLHVSTSRFFPTVAELRQAAGTLLIEQATGGAVSSVDRWADVQRMIVNVGSYGRPTFDDPVTAKVVEAMGWRNLCLSDNPIADRAHFLKLYDNLSASIFDQVSRPSDLQAPNGLRMIESGTTRLISQWTGEREVLE